MKIRKSEYSDINDIMKIIEQAQEYLKLQGINQWQNHYPNENVIRTDIEKSRSYVLEIDDVVAATCVISFEGEKTYDYIEEGSWLTQSEFAVMHRIAVNDCYKGQSLASEFIAYTKELCKQNGVSSIRIDTHEQNRPMRAFLIKNQFEYCGIIYLADGAQRVAYEKVL